MESNTQEKIKVLILGCNGMLGHMLSLYLSEHNYDVYGYARSYSKIINNDHMIIKDITDFKYLNDTVLLNNFDVIINCAGKLNKACDNDPKEAFLINSYLPHFLADITRDIKTKIIHISTDCVFSGDKGSYKVDDIKDASSMYGMTKALGELNDNKNLTLRTSIIGPDLNENGIGLFNWFIHQKESATGFTQAFWSGVTTLELSKIIKYSIENNIVGIYNVAPSSNISKYDLLKLLNKYFNNIELIKKDTPKIDKSLVNNFPVYNILSYKYMIIDLYDWINTHSIYKKENKSNE